MWRFLTRIILALLLLAPELALASAVQDKVFSLIIDAINGQIQGKLEAQTLEFSAPSTVRFSNVIVYSKSGKKLISAKSVAVTVALTDLFSGKLTFKELEINEPVAHLEVKDGKLDLLSLFGGSGDGSGPTIRFDRVLVNGGDITLKTAENSLRLQKLVVESGLFDSDFKKVSLTRFQGDFSGTQIPASASFDGVLTINNLAHETLFDYAGSLNSLKVASRQLPNTKLTTALALDKNYLTLKRLSLTSPKANVEALGSLSLASNQMDASYDSRLTDTSLVFPELDPKISAHDLHVKGTLKGPLDRLVLQGKVDGKWQTAKIEGDVRFNIKSEHLNGVMRVTGSNGLDLKPLIGSDVQVSGLQAHVTFNGNLDALQTQVTANITTVALGNPKIRGSEVFLEGQTRLTLKNPSLDGDVTMTMKRVALNDLALSGAVIKAQIKGPIKNLSASGTLSADNLGLQDLHMMRVQSRFSLEDNRLTLDEFLLGTDQGSIRLKGFSFNGQKLSLQGEGDVENFDLFQAFFKEVPNSSAPFSGTISIAGSSSHPQVKLDGVVRKFRVLGNELGDVDIIGTLGDTRAGIVQLSAALRSDKSKADLQVALDTGSREIKALASLANIRFDDTLDKLKPWLQFGPSTLSGQLEVSGSMSNPTASLAFVLNADRADEQMNLLAMSIGATLSNHKFSFGGCANVHRNYAENEPCLPAVPIKIKGDGTLNGFNDFTLHYNAQVQSDNFERVSDVLRKEAIQLRLDTTVEGTFEKKPGRDVKHEGSISVTDFLATLPDDQPVKLEKPIVFNWENAQFTVEPHAHFLMSDGEFSIGGEFSAKKIAAEFDGRIPLYLARLLNRNVVAAAGVVAGNVVVSGDLEKPSFRGFLRPEKGSFLRVRALPANIEFESGELRASIVTEEKRLVRLDVDQIRLRIGNGVVSLNGQIDLDHLTQDSEEFLRRADVSIIGSDISAIMRDFAIEGDISFNVKTEDQVHWLRGSAKVGAGKLSRDFNLDGFEINAVRAPASEFVWPKFFNRFKTDVALDLSPFDIDADFGPFEFSGSISGSDLRISGDLTRMRIFGNLVLTLGVLKFPAIDFDIPTTQIPLRNSPGKMVDPDIDIRASAELGKDFGLTQDSAVELSLKGDLDHLHLDLTPGSGERQLDRQKILAILLNLDFGPSILLRPLIAQFENLLKDVTKTRIRIGQSLDEDGFSTKISWRLNSRLEISGSSSSKQLGLGDVRFKLKLFDHLPIGKDLSFEGIFRFLAEEEKGQQNLQLNYRLFEK